MTQTEQTSARIRYQRKLAKPPRKLRHYGPRFYFSPDPDFQRIQVALKLMAEDEDMRRGRNPNRENPQYQEIDTLIMDACVAAAGPEDRARIEHIRAIRNEDTDDAEIGPKMGAEILAALGRFLDDNGKGPK